MRPEIDWKECVKDSPKFRAALEEAEQDFDAFEAKLDKIVRLCGCVLETGKTFGNANSAFIVGLKETTSQFGDDQLVTETVDKFTQALNDWQTYYNVMLEQFNVSFSNNLTGFMKNDMRKVKETKRRYHKHAEELQSALCRNAQLSRSKSDDCADTSSHVSQTRLCFTRASLEHMLEINWLQKKKRIEILNSVLSYIGAHISFVQQINDLFICLEPFRQQVETQLEELQRKAALERQAMEETNGKVLCSIIGSSPGDGAGTVARSTDCKMEGYLFKRTSNAFKSWVRRWFIVENNQLLYCSRQQTRRYGDSTGVTVIERDLRLCNVRPLVDAERRFCFQIISPTRCHVLQADSEAECQSWISAIQDGASNAYGRRPGSAGGRYSGTTSRMTSDSSSNTLSPDTRHHHTNSDVIQSILSVQGNNRCCDCGVKDPCWASINFGITLCIECSGIHRSFGVHKSKVRSVTLDAWEPEQVSVMLELGNRAVNEIFEAAANSSNIQRATPDCSRSVREAWIKAKYMDKAFVLPSSSSKTSGDHRLGPPLSSSHRHRRVLTDCGVKTSSSFVEQSDSLLSSSMIRQGASQDSGLGGSTDGIIVSRHKNSCNDSISAVASDVLIESSDTDSLSVDSDTLPNVDVLLCHAALRGCLGDMLRFLALGANVNCQLAEDGDKTPLMKAIESGHMAAVEFLLLNGAKCDICDCQGRAALHYAAQLGHTGHICLLLKRNANQHIKDLTGLDALTIAVNNGDANVVTLLRFARLNEEMKATDSLYDLQVDDTFAAMFRDFTNLAHNGVQHSSQQNDASS